MEQAHHHVMMMPTATSVQISGMASASVMRDLLEMATVVNKQISATTLTPRIWYNVPVMPVAWASQVI